VRAQLPASHINSPNAVFKILNAKWSVGFHILLYFQFSQNSTGGYMRESVWNCEHCRVMQVHNQLPASHINSSNAIFKILNAKASVNFYILLYFQFSQNSTCYRPPPQYPVVAQRVLSRLAYVTSPRLHYITMTPRDISYELYIVAERENSSSARFQKKEYTQPVLRCDPPRHSTAFTLLKSFLYVVVVKSTRSFRNSTYLTRSRQLPPSGDRHRKEEEE